MTIVEGRYVGVSEAVYRISEFGYVDRQPFVVYLDIQLESHHNVYFEEVNKQTAAVSERPATKKTE